MFRFSTFYLVYGEPPPPFYTEMQSIRESTREILSPTIMNPKVFSEVLTGGVATVYDAWQIDR